MVDIYFENTLRELFGMIMVCLPWCLFFGGKPAVRPKDVDMFTVRLQLTEGGERAIARDVELLGV